jgi:hypothetical protein
MCVFTIYSDVVLQTNFIRISYDSERTSQPLETTLSSFLEGSEHEPLSDQCASTLSKTRHI